MIKKKKKSNYQYGSKLATKEDLEISRANMEKLKDRSKQKAAMGFSTHALLEEIVTRLGTYNNCKVYVETQGKDKLTLQRARDVYFTEIDGVPSVIITAVKLDGPTHW